MRADDGDVLISVRVKPHGRSNSIEGTRNGGLMVSVTAAPEDGKANAAVLQVLAVVLKLPKSALSVQRGHRVRDKTVRIVGLSLDEVRQRLHCG